MATDGYGYLESLGNDNSGQHQDDRLEVQEDVITEEAVNAGDRNGGEIIEGNGDINAQDAVEIGVSGVPYNGQSVGMETDVDIVFVIDTTASMNPFLNKVKQEALQFMPRLEEQLKRYKRFVKQVRLKVISFRDYFYDYVPMNESRFFLLPEELEEYKAFVTGLRGEGGEDDPESGLEALHLAMRSQWSTSTTPKKRQIIVLFTDQSAHPLNDPMRYNPDFNSKYPDKVPESLEDLEMEWRNAQKIDQIAKRLVLFTPNMDPWNRIKVWDNVAEGGVLQTDQGGADLSMNVVYQFIARSI